MSDGSLLAVLADGMSICRVTIAGNGTLIGGLFLTGLVGSLTHCAGMCGPFVLSQVTARLEAVPASRMSEWTRLAGAALLPYHAGRTATYVALGAAAAGAAGAFARWSGFRVLAAGLLLAAAGVLLAMAVPRLKAMLAGGGTPGWWADGIGRLVRPFLANPSGVRGAVLGVLLGFIPCGLVYAALAAAAASGDWLAGALGMAAFAAGTVPVLVAVGLVGHAAVGQWREPMLRWAPLLLVANAGMLGVMAWRMLA